MSRILIIEDEEGISDFLESGLVFEGYRVSKARTGGEGISLLKREKFDLIILDIMLPDIDGFDVCRAVRRYDNNVSILMLTAKKEISDKVKGLDSGADDYLTKPFSFDELLARIRALLRRKEKSTREEKLQYGRLLLRIDTHEFYVDSNPVYLTPTEFKVLETLMKNPRRVFSREFLLNNVWGYNYYGDTNIVDVHISHIREKIGDRPPKYIRTIYGIGYAFYPDGR